MHRKLQHIRDRQGILNALRIEGYLRSKPDDMSYARYVASLLGDDKSKMMTEDGVPVKELVNAMDGDWSFAYIASDYATDYVERLDDDDECHATTARCEFPDGSALVFDGCGGKYWEWAYGASNCEFGKSDTPGGKDTSSYRYVSDADAAANGEEDEEDSEDDDSENEDSLDESADADAPTP